LKLALSALGLPHEGLVDIAPEELIDRRCWIEVKSEVGSDQKVRNVITFEGYRASTEPPQARTAPGSPEPPRRANAPEAEGDVPF